MGSINTALKLFFDRSQKPKLVIDHMRTHRYATVLYHFGGLLLETIKIMLLFTTGQ